MNQLLSALPRVQPSALTPGSSSQDVTLTTEADTPQTFAHTLEGELGDSAGLPAATQALLSDVAMLLPATVLTPAAVDGVLPSTTTDDGNSSPESGNDLPLALESINTLLQMPAVSLDTTEDSASQLTLSDPTQGFSDPNRAFIDAAVQAGLQASPMAAQLPVASAPPRLSTSELASELTTNSNVGQESSALTISVQGQTTSHDRHAQQQHSSKDLELLTSVASVLIPVKDRTTERFELAIPATLNSMTPEVTTVNTSTPPLNSGVMLSPNVAATPVTASGKTDFAIPSPLGHPGWSDVFADRVTFVVKQGLQEAEIRLNPPQLGPVDVRIVMSNDQANLMFSSPHGAVREAIELSVGRLRDMLADSGFNLVNVDVSDKSLAQQHKDAREQGESGRGGAKGEYRADFELAANAPGVLRTTGTRSIDYYV